jgi:hypothetical protein
VLEGADGVSLDELVYVRQRGGCLTDGSPALSGGGDDVLLPSLETG